GDARALAAPVPEVPARRQGGGDDRRRVPRGGAARGRDRSARLDRRLRDLPLRLARVDHCGPLASRRGRAARRAVAGDRVRHDRDACGDRPPSAEHQPPPSGHGNALPLPAAAPALQALPLSLSAVWRGAGVPPPSAAPRSPAVPYRSATTSCVWIVLRFACRDRPKSLSSSAGYEASVSRSATR